MRTRSRWALFVFGTALVLAFGTNARATNYVVDRADDPPGAFLCQDAVPNDCTFRYAVSLAGPSDQVHFAANMVGATIVLNDTINLNMPFQNTGPTDIVGPGADQVTVKYAAGYIFSIFDDNVRNISKIRFADSAGGFISQSNLAPTTLNLDQVRFDNVGTPISARTNSTYSLTNSTVSGSGNIINPGHFGISGDSFLNGQTRAFINSGLAQIVGSTFSGHHIPDQGGAIYNAGNLSVFGSNFTNNTSAQGGAIYSQPSSTINIDGGTYSGNQGVIGGALCLDLVTSGRVANATFSGNSAGQDGGAIIAGGTTQFLNLTISGNQAAQNGGGIDLFSPTAAYLRQLTVYNNRATNKGGGIYSENAAPNIANTIVAGNTAGAMFPDTNAAATSSLIGVDPKLAPLGNYGGSTFTHALTCGSPARDAGNATLAVESNGTPLATDQRGAGFGRNANGTVDIGAVETAYALVTNTLDGAADVGSLRKTVADALPFEDVCFDPAYFNVPRTLSLNNASIVIGTSAMIEGPGSGLLTIDAHFASRNISTDPFAGLVRLSGMTLTHGGFGASDPSPGFGASILVGGFDGNPSGSTLMASDLIVSNNDPSGSSACVYNKGTLNLSSSTITGCTGGGLYNILPKTATIDHTLISNNTTVQGAGVYNEGALTITNSTIELNQAAFPVGGSGSPPLGGGIFNYTTGNLHLDRSSVLNNGAQLGGGLYNLGYTELKNSTFSGNHANLTNNGPTGDGGAVYATGNYVGTTTATIDVINCTIAGNSATTSGGGIYMKQIAGSFALQNLVNSIVALNSSASAPDLSGEVISYGHNLIGNNQSLSWAANSPSLAGNILGTPGSPLDPKFAPFGDYGGPTKMLVLLPNSPAINAADPAFYPATDQRGVARPVGGLPDMGAYERNITIDQATLFNGVRYVPYLSGNGAQLSATRNSFAAKGENEKDADRTQAAMQFAVAAFGGSLPPGLNLSPTGLLSGTPTTAGIYTFVIKATDTDGSAGAQQYTMIILVPTAASVSVSGRAVNPEGVGLSGVAVTLTAPDGTWRAVLTNGFGYYRFDGVEAGRTYVVSAISKRYRIDPRVVEVSNDLVGVDLVSTGGSGRR